MYKIGITGGIGCGKSNIVNAFAHLGVPVYKADDEAKRLNESSPTIRSFLTDLLGPETYFPNGHLNKGYMASRIFSDDDLLQRVNQIVHAEVLRDFLQWTETMSASGAEYVVCEAAIMIENDFYKYMDMLIVADLDLETRISRTMTRDKSTREQVLARMRKQLPQEDLLKYADLVLCTDDKHPILREILNINSIHQ